MCVRPLFVGRVGSFAYIGSEVLDRIEAAMTPEQFAARLRDQPMLLDGGLGTLLISMGLEPGAAPENWVVTHPDRIREAHGRYARAGCDIVHTATFGATPTKLSSSGVSFPCDEINAMAVALAREVCGSALVAGDVGPTGRFLPPTGDATEGELDREYHAQVEALAKAGVDLISIETMYDQREALAALRAAKDTGLGVMCCMTFEVKKRGIFTFMGNALGPTLQALVDAGATAVGFNCSVTSDVMVGMVREARGAVPDAYIVAQPNAGQPITTPAGIHYDADAEAFASDAARMMEAGARIVGGCCGTDETFIRAMRRMMDKSTGR